MRAMRTFVLVVCLLTAVASGSSDQGSCLLATRRKFLKVLSFEQDAATHLTWRLHHESLQQATNASKNVLDELMEKSQNSSDPCNVRLLDAKKQLDDLVDDVKDISDKIQGHQKALETETEAMSVAEESIKEVKNDAEEELAACNKQRHEAVADLAKHLEEKKELDGIATATSNSVSLLSGQGMLDMQSCLAFVAFTERVAQRSDDVPAVGRDPDTGEEVDCDAQRQDLAEKFADAYNKTLDVIKEAEARTKDETCDGTANAKKDAALVPLTSEQEEAAERAGKSTEAIDKLKPVLQKMNEQVEKLSDHINGELKPECEKAEIAADTLEKVRDEIQSLEKCPTKKDWILKAPEGAGNAVDPDKDEINQQNDQGASEQWTK